MQHYTVAPTTSSPEIHFNPETNTLLIAGESYPENCSRFYQPMFAWLGEYLAHIQTLSPIPQVELTLEILYFNSSSSKTFMDLFDMLDDAAADGIAVTIRWRYHEENETALECGEEFQEDVQHLTFILDAMP